MGKIENEKYTSEEDRNSQVRSIINQLNADRPSSEKSREVVLRADGTKAVRVVKKRKVMVTNEDKARRARKKFVYSLLVILLFVGALAGCFAYRVASMSGEAYFKEAETRLTQAFGAESVRLVGCRLDGLRLHIDNIVAEFPESSMLQRAEMSDINCELLTSSFFTSVLSIDEVKVARTTLSVREGVTSLNIPIWQGEPIWSIRRMVCDDFSCYVGDPADGVLSLAHCSAYMYSPRGSEDARVLIFKGGTFRMRGWKGMNVLDGKMQVTPVALEGIRLQMTTEALPEKGKAPSSQMVISGNIGQGESLSSPLMMDADNMNFSDFTAGKFTHLLNAKTRLTAVGKGQPGIYITLPIEGEKPTFRGEFALKDVRLAAMPAMLEIVDHIEPVKRAPYMPPSISQGKVKLTHEEGSMKLAFGESDLSDSDHITLRGEVVVNAQNEMSGTIAYGIPAILTHVEYPDALADPIFTDDGVLAWVSTTLSGPANAPTDNIAELESRAEVQRRERPQRTPFDRIDVDALSDEMLGTSHTSSEPAAPQSQEPAGDEPVQRNSGNPFELKHNSNPFEISDNPFDKSSGDDGLTMPVEKSIFPSN